jgi:hypothetical protein
MFNWSVKPFTFNQFPTQITYTGDILFFYKMFLKHNTYNYDRIQSSEFFVLFQESTEAH